MKNRIDMKRSSVRTRGGIRTRWLSLCLILASLSCSPSPGPTGSPPPPSVTVAKPIIRQIVEWDRYTGRLAAVDSVEIRARVSGYLESIHFGEGQLVKKGDLLAVIDQRPFEADLAREKATLEEAKARLARSKALLAQAQAENVRATSASNLAKSRLANAEQALATNSIAKEQVDVRESEYAQAQADVEATRAAIASAEAEIASAEAAIHTAEVRVERAELDLSYTRVTAPISGRISNRLVTKGNLIQGGTTGATAITDIVSLDPIHVYFDANEQAFLKYLRLADKGERPSSRESKNPVYVALMDEEGYPHRGHIDFVDNRLDPETGTMRGRGILRNPDLLLTPGLFATVRVPGSARYDAVMTEDKAIGSNQTQRFVYVVDAENKVTVQPVKLGPMIDGLRVIREGLTGEERVIVGGVQRVQPGSVVNPTEKTIELDPMRDGLPNDYQPVPEEEWIPLDLDPEVKASGTKN